MLARVACLVLVSCASSGASSSATAPGAEKSRADEPPGPTPGGAAGTDGYTIEVLALTRQPAMAMSGRVPPMELEDELGAVIPRVLAYALANRLQIAGPPFVRYLARSPEMIEYQAGLPVLRTAEGTDAIRPAELPAGPAAATVHVGPYRELPAAHAALEAWRVRNQRAVSGAPWEVFLTNPLEEPDPQNWRTKVFLPLQSVESSP